MNRFNYLSMAVIAVLMVFAVGCTTLQEGSGGYYEDAPRSRVYRQVPYGSNQVIVVERDPFTGQYYQVSPYGYYGGSPYSAYGYPGAGYGYPSVPRGAYRGGNYRSNNSGSVRQAPVRQQQPQPQPRRSESNDKARAILGGN